MYYKDVMSLLSWLFLIENTRCFECIQLLFEQHKPNFWYESRAALCCYWTQQGAKMGRQIFILSFSFFLLIISFAFSQSELLLDPGLILFCTKVSAISMAIIAPSIWLPIDQRHPAPFRFEDNSYFSCNFGEEIILKI